MLAFFYLWAISPRWRIARCRGFFIYGKNCRQRFFKQKIKYVFAGNSTTAIPSRNKTHAGLLWIFGCAFLPLSLPPPHETYTHTYARCAYFFYIINSALFYEKSARGPFLKQGFKVFSFATFFLGDCFRFLCGLIPFKKLFIRFYCVIYDWKTH